MTVQGPMWWGSMRRELEKRKFVGKDIWTMVTDYKVVKAEKR